MASIKNLLERQKDLEKRIEEQKDKSHEYLGEEIIKELGISYELVSTKKDTKEVVEMIKESLSINPFKDDENENNTPTQKDQVDTNDNQQTAEY